MDKETLEAWQKIKDHFDEMPEEERENHYYKRAVAIIDGKDDPLELK